MKSTNCMQNFDFVEKIFRQWKGKITRTEQSIFIENENMLKDKKIDCKVEVGYLKNEKYPYYVDACEKTYCIIGGCGCPCENEKEVVLEVNRVLQRYKFEQEYQLSLFDF